MRTFAFSYVPGFQCLHVIYTASQLGLTACQISHRLVANMLTDSCGMVSTRISLIILC